MERGEVRGAKFRFVDYIISETNIFIKDKEIGTDMSFDILPKGWHDEENNRFEVTMSVSIKDDQDKLNIDMVITGHFEYDSECSFNDLMPYLSLNAPAILFPYLRAYISNITALGGLMPLITPTLNMEGVGKILLKQMEKDYSTKA